MIMSDVRPDNQLGKLTLTLALALASPLPATAQSSDHEASPAADQAEQQPSEIGEVIVTARKSSERLQDVPLSITALSSENLERAGTRSIADIGRETPGLNVVSVGPGQNQLIIRGVSSSGGVPTVGFYIDDTPIESVGNVAGGAMDPALFDLDHVEVLRGPQGTLYGASSMGGTVKYVTGQPNLTATQAAVTTTLSGTNGGGPNYEVRGLLNVPLMPDLAAVRVAVFYRDDDGYIDRYPINPNHYLQALSGPVTKHVNTEKSYGARLSVEVKANDILSITPSIWLQRTDLGAPFTVDDPPGSLRNMIQTRDVDEPITDELSLFALTVAADLGSVHLTSSTSYRDRRFDAVEDDSKVNDYYFSPEPQSYVYPVSFDNYFANHDFAEELRGTARLGVAHGLLGLFYLHQRNDTFLDFPISPGYNAAFGSPFGDAPFFVETDTKQVVQRAAFGELNVDVTKNLEATVGLRVFGITQEDHSISTGVFNGPTTTVGNGSSTDHGITPKYEVSYRFTPDVLAYTSATKGFRQGGPIDDFGSICNADLPAVGLDKPPTSFKADSIWNYEVGAKTSWLDRRLSANAGVYYIDWTNIQQLVLLPRCGLEFTGNFGRATSKGSELELQYTPVSGLHLSVGTAYNEAKLVSTVAGAQGHPGDTLENAPRWTGSASVDYTLTFNAATSAYGRVDFSTTSREYNTFDSSSIYYNSGGYSLANLRVGAMHSGWDTALVVQNAFDKHAETALPVSYAADLPTTRRVSVNRPRTIGLQVKFGF
jgi:iron complex outermembrane recepter protein